MSQENVEVVRRHMEAWNRCDLTTLSTLWRSDGEIDWSHARGPLKGVYRGQRERETFWNEFWSTFEVVQLDLSDFRHTGPYVLASNTAHMRGRDGIEVTARNTSVYTLEDGLITRLEMFQERSEALEAAGLEE